MALDERRWKQLLHTSNVKAFSPASLRVLQSYERDEEKILRSTAHHYSSRLGRSGSGVGGGVIDVDSVRLACLDRRLMQAPLRTASIETARITNSRTVAWPLGPHVRVPFDCALDERIESTLSSSSSSSVSISAATATHINGMDSAKTEYVPSETKILVELHDKKRNGEESLTSSSAIKKLRHDAPLEAFSET